MEMSPTTVPTDATNTSQSQEIQDEREKVESNTSRMKTRIKRSQAINFDEDESDINLQEIVDTVRRKDSDQF